MKNSILILTFLAVSFAGYAQEKNKKMAFEVDGKCDMCKNRIEKAALGVDGVKYAVWDIPTHQLSLVVDERKTNAMEIKSALVAVGHDTKELKATQEAYDNIHPCCRYRENSTDDSGKHR
ncbi:heavy-metal-associated domain-containing protein [Allomuricauda sp. SCSIO 65647]|uniref:heavy-metal-associated domain-containing protein n=1 Tax=Allomuricauda sp. SCSIO 65647 TaxID=2908843 RepID=UPI001F31C980|nr:heavy-metal-associated domain-containing protein [Muricauda sp. SCSIO 65647]UJH66320.1 heavy-metal-associated domain-containing protein [Muricauda sp. SCSIO 65647]